MIKSTSIINKIECVCCEYYYNEDEGKVVDTLGGDAFHCNLCTKVMKMYGIPDFDMSVNGQRDWYRCRIKVIKKAGNR